MDEQEPRRQIPPDCAANCPKINYARGALISPTLFSAMGDVNEGAVGYLQDLSEAAQACPGPKAAGAVVETQGIIHRKKVERIVYKCGLYETAKPEAPAELMPTATI